MPGLGAFNVVLQAAVVLQDLEIFRRPGAPVDQPPFVGILPAAVLPCTLRRLYPSADAFGDARGVSAKKVAGVMQQREDLPDIFRGSSGSFVSRISA